MKKLFNFFKEEFRLETTECMNNQQKVALKNIISAARERVWIAEPLHSDLTDVSGFYEELMTDTQSTILESANILENYLNEQNKPTK